VEIQSNLIFIVLSVLAIVSKYTSPNNLYRLFKLLPIIILLIIWVASFGDIQSNPYTRAILVDSVFLLSVIPLLFPAQFKLGVYGVGGLKI